MYEEVTADVILLIDMSEKGADFLAPFFVDKRYTSTTCWDEPAIWLKIVWYKMNLYGVMNPAIVH